MSDIDKFLDEPVSDTPAKTSAVDSFMEDAPDTAKGFGGALRDTAVAAGSGAVTGVQLLANAAGAGNAVSQKLGDAADYVRGFETEARREERAARAEKIKKAEASGSTWEEVKANVGAFAEAPIDTTVEALGTSLPTIAATALTRGKLRAPVAGAMGAAQGAGTVKGAIYDAVKQQHLDAGATPEEVEARAVEAQAYGGDNAGQIALGAGLGVAAGTTGVEGVVGRMLGNEAGEAAAQGVIRSTLLGAAKEAPLEAAQGGQERLASNIALQNEGFDTPTWQGVAGQAALEGLAGAAAGGGFGAVESAFAHDSQSAPVVDPTELAGDEPAADPAPAADPVVEPQAPTAGPLAAGMPPPQVQPQYRTERPYPARPSEQMGLDPAAGALSDAAATAVDSGATAQLAQQAAEQQAAEQAQKDAKKGAKAGEQIDTSTGEITQAAGDLLAGDPAAALQDDLNFVKQAARANGWDARLVAERDRIEGELAKLQPATEPAKAEAAKVEPKADVSSDRYEVGQTWRSSGGKGSYVVESVSEDGKLATVRSGKNNTFSVHLDAEKANGWAPEQKPAPANLQEGIAQAQARNAQAKPADQADVSPETVTAPAAAEASTQPAADQPAGDIKAITAKQIPQMTDAELAQAIDHYGPGHKRTAKLQNEQAKRATQGAGNVPQAAETVEASPQPAQVAGQAPAADAQAAGAATAGSAASVDHGARWEAMSRDERQALAEKSGVKPVFVKSLPGAPWDRIGETTQQKLAAAMAAEPAVKDPHIERMQENKRLLARPSRELVAQAEAMGIHDAEQHSNVESLEARMKARQEHESRDTGGGWYAFHPDSGTVGIPRAEMPQIKAEHRGAMVNFLNARGVQHKEATVPASALKPTQAEFSRDKVARARDFEGGNRSILISQDGHVLDGHHQWLAAREKGEDVKVISLGAPIRELVKLAREFPSSTADAASNSTTSPSEQVESKQADEYAARLRKLGDEFQGSYSGRSLAPLARAMADHAIEQGRRLTDAEIADMGKRFDVPADVVEQLTGNIFAFDAMLGDAQRREPGAVALRKRQSQAGTNPSSLKEGIEAVRAQKAASTQEAEAAPAKGPLEIPEATFADLLQAFAQDDEGIPTFTEPSQTVRSEDRAKAAGEVTQAQADQQVAEWEAHAKAQRKSGVNNGKVVLSLFDTSGEWSQPWVDAGYEVHRFDIQDGMDVNDFSVEYLTEKLGIERADVILAAPPCTDFSSSGAHAWKKKDADGRTQASIELVQQTLRAVEFFKPLAWALENPVGRIQKLTGLPKPTMTFQPSNFGNPYTKRTLLWGDFNTEFPLASVAPSEGSKITDKLSGKDKYERSLTPKGFAYSFFMANNLADMAPAQRLAAEFKGIERADFAAALDAGVSEADVRTAIEDSYNDQDLEGARQALRDTMPTEPDPGAKAESTEQQKPAEYGASNKLVSADRAAELRAKLRAKLNGSQLNSGLDPEILAMGTELAIFHLEASARRFAEFARLMADDLGQPLEKIKPYLRMWYNGARDGMEDQGASIEGMDGPDEVRAALATLDDKPAQQGEAPGRSTQESDSERLARIKATPPAERTDADLDWYVEYRQRARAEGAASAEAAEAASKEAATSPSLNNYVKDMAPNVAALAIKALNKPIRIDGKAATLREHVEAWHAAGELSVSTSQEPRIKPMSRRDFNRATQAEQRMHEKRMQAAGSKTVYYVNDYDLGKTAHDYAAALLRDEIEADPAAAAPEGAEPKASATPWDRFEQLRSEGHGEMPEVIAFAKVAGATGEKPADVYNRWQSVMGFMGEVEKGTGQDLANLMGRALVKEPYKVDTAYPGSNPPAVSDLASAQRFAERTAKAMESFNKDMALYDARTFDAERFGVDAALVKAARDAIQQMRNTAATNERAAQELVKDAEAKEKADAEAEAQAKRDGYEAADLRELSVKPTAAKVTNWMTGTFQGQTVYSSSGHLIDLSGNEPHLKGWAERMDRLRTTISENAVANVVAGSNVGRAAVKLEPLAVNDRPDLKDSKQAVFSRKDDEPAVYLNLNYVRYFLSKFKGAEFFAGDPNSRGDYGALQVRLNGELVGILSPISMKEDARTPNEIRGFMQASGKAEVKPKSVVERAKAVKAESGAAAARFQVVAINERTGAKEYLSFGEPMTQDQAIKFKQRFSEHPARRIQLEAVQDSQAAQPEKPRSIAAKAAEAKVQALADYFTPGNVVPSYGGNFDRVISYQAPDKDGHWSVTVRAVEKRGDSWVDKPGERERNHMTLPDARELKAGPVGNVAQDETDATPKAWHTEMPTEGLPLTKEQREGKADAYRALPGKLAENAVNAVTPVQLQNDQPLSLYVLPAANGGNGIARFVPEDQTPPAPWKKIEGKPFSLGWMTRDQMIAQVAEKLRNEPIIGSAATASAPSETAVLTNSRRDPRSVTMFNPYLEGDIVTLDGKDWTVRSDMPGWYLTNTGNWRGQHPTIHSIKSMEVLIREIEQAATATAEPEGEAFPTKEAAASYSGISHRGTDRAKSDKAEFEAYIDGARSSAMTVAHTQAQRDAVDQAIKGLRADYLAQYRRLMNVRAGTVSSYVAGGSNFNSKQASARNSAYDRAIEAFTTWQAANTHKARKAALDARTDAEKAADQAAASQAIEDKAQKERDADLTLMRKILSWKKGGEPVAIGKSAVLDGVNKGRDGYPTSIKLKPTDGSTLADDKFDLAALFRNRKRGESVPDSRRRVRELVDAVRAEDATASAQVDAQAAEPAKSSDSKTPLLDAHVAAMDQARDGKIDPEAFRAAFAQVEANGEAMRAEMNSMSKDKLLRAGGVYFYHRHKDDRKAEVVEALYRTTLDEYSLGKSYGPNSYMLSGNGLANHRAAKAQALRDLVAGTDEAALQQFAAEIAESRKEREARKEATRQALENPKTLPEFRSFISYHAEKHSETRREAYLRLTPEQRRRYDELEAEGTREAREQAKNKQRTKIASAGNTTAGEVIATKHTKHGHDLYVVKLEERVSREDYDTLNSSAKRMGGSYSSYRGNGAIPGFQFRTREAAEAFRKLVAGDTEAAQEVAQARRDAFEDDRSQSAVERLRTMAAALNERAEEELGRDRKVNTARRARMASAAEAAANANKALAGTMENIADAIEAGKAKFLDLVRQKVQVEFLGAELRNAKDAQIRAKYPSYADQVKHQGQPIDDETVDYSDYPTYGGMRSDLAGIARQMIEVDGLKNLGQRLLKVADDVSDAYVEWAKNNLQSVSRFARGEQFAEFTSRDDAERAIRRSNLSDRAIVLPLKRGVNRIVLSPSEAMKQGVWQGDDKRIGLSGDFGREIVEAVGRRAGSKIKLPWQLETVHAKRKRLEGMGIYTGSEYRAALREFADLQQAMATPDKIKQMERAMIGRRSDGLDFFPTSEAVVDSMLEAAEIAEGMGVLEPSAGMGHIADAIREKTGVEPDVVELSGERRELLQAKGYHLAGDDFMAMQPRTFYTFGDIFQAPDGTKGIMRGGRAWSGRASLHAINEDGSEGKMLGWYDRDDLTGIEQRGSWSGYDRIVMNPPFSKGRDIQHVQHAYSLLKPGGRLVAIMGEGAFFQSNSAAEGFRAWLDDLGATSERLPENSFMDAALPVNTAVNARMVVIDKPDTDTSGITADSARRAAVRARVAANNYSREDENFLQGMLKALYEKTGDSVLEHKLSTWLDSRYQRLEAVDQLYAEHDKAFAGKGDVLFSRRPVNVARGATPVLSHDAVKAIVERIGAGLKLGIPSRSYRSEAELYAAHPEIAEKAERDGAKGQVNAVYYKGQVHVVTSAFVFEADVEGAILEAMAHEGQGHYGIRALHGNDGRAVIAALREFFAAIGGVAGVKRLAGKHGIDMSLYLETASEMTESQRAIYLADELLAHLQGREAVASLSERARAAVRALYAAVREMLSRIGAKRLAKGSDADISLLLARMRRASKRTATASKGAPRFSLRPPQTASEAFKRWFGKSQAVGADGQPLNLYHGTAADFTVFDQSRAGSATGHATSALGIFMSSDRRAAQNYAEKASDGMPGYGRVMDLYASIQNPYLMSVEESQEVESPLEARRLRTRLEQQGYDGIRLKGTPVWIAFNNYQVKSATDNSGAFDEFDPDIRFSRSAVRGMASRATQELNRTFSAPGGLSWWHKTVGTMYNLAQRSPHFKPVFEAAQGFIDDVSHYASDAAELAPKLLPKLETLRDIAKSPVKDKDNKAIAAPIFEGTLMWARDEDGKPVRVDESSERKPGIVWTDAELRSMWSLSDGQIELYREFREAINRSLDTMARSDMLRFGGDDVKAMRERVMDAADAKEASLILQEHLAELIEDQPERAAQLMDAAKGINDRAERVAQLQAEGYAPLSRFGKYTVDVVGEDGARQYFSLFETKREANLMAEQMRAAFPGSTVSQGTLSEEAFKLFAGITPETLELFGNAMGLDSSGDGARDKVFQDYLKLTKTNRSAMKRLIHRKGIAGYSEDVGRVLASFVYSNARQTAAGLNMGDLSESVNAIPQEQGELKDAAVRLAEYIKNPQEEAQALRGLLFAQYLGGSVASAFVNMTQPVAVTFPWLSQYGGAKRAAKELGKAARQMATKGHQYEADLARALHLAEEDGTVSPQEVHQLMAQASGTGGLRAGDGTRSGDARALASNSLARLSLAWGKLFGSAEEVNRRMTFIAAYRIAKEDGAADPEAFARLAVRETQFVYSKASKMRWGRGAVGGTLMTFKTYSIAYLELMGRLWNQGEAGSQARKDGRKAALLMLATLLLLSGAGGLPFAEDAEDLIDGMAQLAGYNFSTQKAKEQFLHDVFGDDIARFIDKGITGLPGAPLDVSGRLGMGNLIPGTGLLQQRDDHSRDVLEIAGPAGDLVKRMISGAHKVASGEVGAGLLEMSPAAVRNLAKGTDMAATGMYRDDKGYKVLDTNTLEAALKAIGFQPQSVASIQEANWLGQRSKAFYSMRAQEIRALWAQGVFEKDPSKVQEARDAVADWNARNPDQPMLISVPDVMRRVREMGKSKDQRIADAAPRAMRQQLREDFARVRGVFEE